MNDFVLYGAYGYTGRLITERAASMGLRPLLAGRNPDKLRPLAEESGFDYRVVDLGDAAALEDLIRDYGVVLHVAGPFVRTAAPMLAACLATDTHYLDISGEIDVFSYVNSLGDQFAAKGLMAMSGVGFDVVPTDCMAAYCREKLPDADRLDLAFAFKGGGVSRGTMQTLLEDLGHPGKVRRDGEVVDVPAAYDVASFPFTADKTMEAVTIPWGDVYTAYHTTGIPNIRTYFSVPAAQVRMMKLSNYIGPLLRWSVVRNVLQRQVEKRPPGPDAEQRARGESYVYGRATNPAGDTFAARLRTPDAYKLTSITALMVVQRVLNNDLCPGYQTPAACYGADFVLEVEGTKREVAGTEM